MRFIHFGCWNNVNCEKINDINYRDVVINYIKENEIDYSYLIVSGDNWYTNKLDIYRYYFTNILYSGFIKLYDLNKPCHIILGNHDEDVAPNEEPNDIRKNCMLNTEKYYIHTINNNKEYSVPTLEDLKHINLENIDKKLESSLKYFNDNTDFKIKQNSKLILYEALDGPDEYIDNDNKLYFLFINTNLFDENFNKDFQIKYINKLKNNLELHKDYTLFIVGHVPITSISIKKENEIYTKIYAYDDDTIHYLINSIKTYKPIYLCADTHNFQITQIDNDIIQIVSGTGGATPDILSMTTNKIEYPKLFLDKYNISGFKENSYGYSVIDINSNGTINVQYIRLIDPNNNIINIKYKYSIIKNSNSIQVKYIGEEKLYKPINISQANDVKQQLCYNLTDKNLVKDKENNDIYCYRKQK